MGRSGQNKEKRGKSGDPSLHNCNEGTAARTRPLSFDEIMIKRKNKNLYENVKDRITGVGNIPGYDTFENASDHCESGRHHKHSKDSSHGVDMHVSGEFVKVGSWNKEDNTLKKDGDSSKQQERESHKPKTEIKDDNLAKPKHRKILKSEIRLKDGSLGREKDRRSHGSEIKLKAETMKEISSKAKGKSEKLIPGQGKIYGLKIDDPKDETKKKHPRDLTEKDRHGEKSREKSGRERKRKRQNGDDEKKKDKNAAKKVDLGKECDLKDSDRKERKESPKSQYGESRLKRRRSRSRKWEDRSRRSMSLSPRAQKCNSYYGSELEELPSHSTKGRSGKQHSDIDRSRVTSNGLSGHYRQHGASTSGLGGYSPRKRRTEAAVKTPSPVNRSPEKKSAKWDVAPAETYSVPSNAQTSNQTASSNSHEVVSSMPVTATTANPLSGISLAKLNVSVDSVQLTQATRPMRRLYVENVPASASEKDVLEFLNNFLLSSGVNGIRGCLPCICCVIQREKGQALVEFLTAEDASAALSCDGCSFSGSILKFRRPKDFVEVASGEAEKSVASVDPISDIVKDSPHKIFIGGISKTLSPNMVMEIASAFGPLKAYHFEVNDNLEEQCAFLEYVDQSLTLKACAGLNGLKVGGQVLTAVQAVPDGSTLENNGNSPFYGIPDHALPLLKRPTPVIKLKNVFNPEGFLSLSDLEVEEVLEDVRLECARFGAIKSVNIVKYDDSHATTIEAFEASENMATAGIGKHLMGDKTNEKGENLEEVTDRQRPGSNDLEFPSAAKQVKEVDEGNSINDNKLARETMGDEPRQLGIDMVVEDPSQDRTSIAFSQDNQLNAVMKDDSCCRDDKVANDIQKDDMSMENKKSEDLNLEEVNSISPETFAGPDGGVKIQCDATENGHSEKKDCNLGHIFEPGCVFVEYRRTEASCTAAHCLHGRLFDDRIVTVEYIPLDLYRTRFPK